MTPSPSPPTASSPSALEAMESRINDRLRHWDRDDLAKRFWSKDPSVWPAATPQDVASRLGWLSLPESMRDRAEEIVEFAAEAKDDGIRTVLVLGTGGSSLGAELLVRTAGGRRGFPTVRNLSSLHPATVPVEGRDFEIDSTLVVVASKSGTTLEPNLLLEHFWGLFRAKLPDPSERFVAITDPGTPLETLARGRSFRECFLAPPDVGGRYSALTEFGLVPAALSGAPIAKLLERAREMAAQCAATVPAIENSGLRLGAEIGELALSGRDKIVLLATPSLSWLPRWAEQLVAESTGKIGKGIVPVAGEVEALDPKGSDDRVVAYFALTGEEDEATDRGLATLEALGRPAIACDLASRLDVAGEVFRWEMAIASAGSIIGIDPFDQPDVEAAKELARQFAGAGPGGAPIPRPSRVGPSDPAGLRAALEGWIANPAAGEYVAVQAFLAPSAEIDEAIRDLRSALRDRTRLTTTAGYGPAFLHSTGQLHKGGPSTGRFLQFVDRPSSDVPTADGKGFAAMHRAQADGDAIALTRKGRRLLLVDGEGDPAGAIRAVSADVRAGAGPA